MEIDVRSTGLGRVSEEALLVLVAQHERLAPRLSALDAGYRTALERLAAREVFDGSVDQVEAIVPAFGRQNAVLIVAGLGKADTCDLVRVREATADGLKRARALGATSAAISAPPLKSLKPATAARAMVEGAILGLYRYERWKKEPSQKALDRVVLLSRRDEESAMRRAASQAAGAAEATCLARDLANEPPNALTPEALAEKAREIAAADGLDIEVFGEEDLRELKMGAFLAVGGGSAHPPRMIQLTYTPEGGPSKPPTVALVGKGLTFDSGGISIKPAAKMEDMKFDMCGAAAVLATLQAVARRRFPLRVVGLMGAAENMPGGGAYRPGDILRAMNGTTIEVRNTDAEGRLVLADVLAYVAEHVKPRPKAVVDLATLTGACVVALGEHHAGLVSNNDALVRRLKAASLAAGEAVWQLPLVEGHRRQMKSPYADVSNLGSPAGAGALTAAAFLETFVGTLPWAHLDIAGVAWSDRANGTLSKGGTGFGVRLLLEFLGSYA